MQLLIFNEEFLVSACHQRALITSLPFVHTARRSYRLNDPVRSSDWDGAAGSPAALPREVAQTLSFRGRRSRNKVSVGEPAEGSLPIDPLPTVSTHPVFGAPGAFIERAWGPRLGALVPPSGVRASAAGRNIVSHTRLQRSAAEWGHAGFLACPSANVRGVRFVLGPAHSCAYTHTTSNNGYLGSRNDEERSEMRYVMRIAEFSESSNL